MSAWFEVLSSIADGLERAKAIEPNHRDHPRNVTLRGSLQISFIPERKVDVRHSRKSFPETEVLQRQLVGPPMEDHVVDRHPCGDRQMIDGG